MWRNDRKNYITKCKELIEKANKEVPDGILIPHPDTNPDEKQKQVYYLLFIFFGFTNLLLVTIVGQNEITR